MENEIVISGNNFEIEKQHIPYILNQIRPAWKSKDLITRTAKLIQVDLSSACQRIFNAAIHDLREKVIVAGIDVADAAAKQMKLPSINTNEDVQEYPIKKLIDLCFGIGLFNRAEWKRISRCYEIRCDLEHEDDEYMAEESDCIYIFKNCIEAVLSKDPINILKVKEVKDIIESPNKVIPDSELIEEYTHVPAPRQVEIMKLLISESLNKDKPEIVRENAYTCIKYLGNMTQNSVKLNLVDFYQGKFGRNPLTSDQVRVMYASGMLPYIHSRKRATFFSEIYEKMKSVGYGWENSGEHGSMLRIFKEIGGVAYCPEPPRKDIIKWCVLAYIGEPGGYGQYGRGRSVFYSNAAAPIIYEMLIENASIITNDISEIVSNQKVKNAIKNKEVRERFEQLIHEIECTAQK